MERGIDTPALIVLSVMNLQEIILKYVRSGAGACAASPAASPSPSPFLSHSDFVADVILDQGGTMALLKCIRRHMDDITALGNFMQLMTKLARTGEGPRLQRRVLTV